MSEYTDAQKWFLITTELDGTLLCDIFRRKFNTEMTEKNNDQLFVTMKKLKLRANPKGWLGRFKT